MTKFKKLSFMPIKYKNLVKYITIILFIVLIIYVLFRRKNIKEGSENQCKIEGNSAIHPEKLNGILNGIIRILPISLAKQNNCELDVTDIVASLVGSGDLTDEKLSEVFKKWIDGNLEYGDFKPNAGMGPSGNASVEDLINWQNKNIILDSSKKGGLVSIQKVNLKEINPRPGSSTERPISKKQADIVNEIIKEKNSSISVNAGTSTPTHDSPPPIDNPE